MAWSVIWPFPVAANDPLQGGAEGIRARMGSPEGFDGLFGPHGVAAGWAVANAEQFA